MTEWNEQDVGSFLRVLDPSDDATGGGTASAVAGSMAAGLTGMVARLSRGREELAGQEDYEAIDAEGRGLTLALLEGGRRDSEAFDAVLRGFRLPKQTDEEKAQRSRAIQTALCGAAQVPLENAERCARVLVLARRLEGRSNPNAASDVACAMGLAHAGALGCLANVEINLSSIKDAQVRRELAERAVIVREALGREDVARA